MFGAWLRLIVNSALVAAVAVAAQLGAGGALGIIAWDGPHDGRAWSTLLTWLAFSYAVAVLAGAMVGRIAVRRTGDDGIASRLTASVVAAGGAAAAIGLAWLPAQGLDPPVNKDPGLVVSLTAGAGVLAGLVLALLALAARPIAVGLQIMAAWLWLLAIVAAAAGLRTHEPFPAPRLGVPDAPSLLPESSWTGPRILIIVAAVVGLGVSAVARWQGSGRLGAALSGFGGPALAASAYLIAGPDGDGGGRFDQPYTSTLIAAVAGLAISVLVAMPGRPSRAPRPAPSVPTPLEGDVIEVARTPTSPTTTQGRARPAWAEGSGPYARAYSGAGPARATAAAPVAAGVRGWDGDTLAGTVATDPARHAQPADGTGGLYRSAATEPTDASGPEPWSAPLRSTGRHAALD